MCLRGLLSTLLMLVLLGSSAAWTQLPEPPHEEDPPSEDSEPESPGRESVGGEDRSDDKPTKPSARLILSTDAPCKLRVGGEDLGVLEPESRLETEVQGAEVVVRAISTESPGAVWTRTVAVEEEDLTIEIAIKMAKAVRARHKLERREKVWANFKSGLMWSREDNRQDVTWTKAREACERSTLGGWTDWRLPTIQELHSLQAKWSLRPFKIADQIALTACCPWSSTEIDEDSAWNFSYRFRRRFEGRKNYSLGLRALCVRYLTVEELQKHDEAVAAAKKKRRGKKKPSEEEDGPR
jgi:hypothetical protein